MPSNRLPWSEFYEGLEKRVASSGVLIENQRGELLVLKANYKEKWSPPGGVIDAGETPLQAAIRETSEETGVTLDAQDLSFQSTIVRLGPDAITYLFVFRATKLLEDSYKIALDRTEIDEYDWVSADTVRDGRDGRLYNHAVQNWASEEPLSYLEAMI